MHTMHIPVPDLVPTPTHIPGQDPIGTRTHSAGSRLPPLQSAVFLEHRIDSTAYSPPKPASKISQTPVWQEGSYITTHAARATYSGPHPTFPPSKHTRSTVRPRPRSKFSSQVPTSPTHHLLSTKPPSSL
ncbi:uncharacterized protein CC84DRAFT_734670 [Paraphaeosphaeria sporulosa]|uniref:Uncharacterized protein n=1 Tax=Paraphaeosphaeria sporulosa TaxID=1460663 RepID=A0A177CG10_9PLEO|nr:uncharacterized protein CC84DRAFT_734670 [Paraphaeosphaeria sporulosa]OAG05759.1 hypothetical protein CC84DRAFT_734670 [Paraphaeosphaeria sporulosa]